MKTVCQTNECTACNACKNRCPVNAIKIHDSIRNYNAYIDQNLCINCGACIKVCQKVNKPEMRKPIMWMQGWSNKMDERSIAASGGIVSAIAKSFKNQGGFVYLCKFDNGEFSFHEMKTEGQMKEFVGSKYVKTNTADIYKTIEILLKKKHRVLFVGLPCQVAGVKAYVGTELEKKLYTIDLICHGTPSAKLLKKFLIEQEIELSKVKSIIFRKNTDFNLYIDDKKIKCKGGRDRYSILFLYGKSYTDNCYKCNFANVKRVSDITVGDSWGTMLDEKQVGKGISLILCQTDKGRKILDDADLSLYDVNLEQAIKNNQQLEHPMKLPKRRTLFFKLNQKTKFNIAAIICYPIPCLKQYVRRLLRRS